MAFFKRLFHIHHVALGICLFFPKLLAEVIDLGKIQARIPVPTYRIAIESSDVTTLGYLRKLFALHGSFIQVSKDQAQLRFRFEQLPDHTIAFEIFQGHQTSPCFTGKAQGKHVESTLRKVADKIVETTLKQPGFFDGKLAFSSNNQGKNELYVTDITFSQAERVTTRSDSITPRWHPTHNELIYTTYKHHGFPDIYTINLDTLSERKIASYRGLNSCGSFDPSGTRIAMVLSSKKGPQIYLSDAYGKQLKALTHDLGSVKATPIWSPDGKSIIYTSDTGGKPQLYLHNLQTGKSSRIAANISGYVAEAHWNPVFPNLISFTAAVGKGFQIGLYDLASKQFEMLTTGPADHMESCWLPDGRHLVLIERTRGQTALCILDSMSHKKVVFSSHLKQIHTPSYKKN